MSLEPSALQMTFSHWPAIEFRKFMSWKWDVPLLCFEVGNILGYFSNIGPIVGVARIIFAITQLNTEPDAETRIPFIARGLTEISPLRICLVPIDLFNTYMLLSEKSGEVKRT